MLTPEEQNELSQLQGEEMAFQAATAPSKGLTPQEKMELQALQREEMMFRENQKREVPSLSEAVGQVSDAILKSEKPANSYQNNPEASLGAINRLQYAIEPLESNRRAFLIQQFGKENVIEDESGELYLKQHGQVRPINKDGFSTADVADVIGSAPELVTAGIGAASGAGVASVPLAAGGAMLGSAIRQGTSALLGTPQVADLSERAVDVGISGTLGGAGAYAGNKLKPIVSRNVKKFFPKLAPSGHGKRLMSIAKKEGIPSPTAGQILGDAARDEEKIISQLPFVGKKVRKQIAEQEETITKNLKEVVGDFFDGKSGAYDFGESLKELGEIKSTKNASLVTNKKNKIMGAIQESIGNIGAKDSNTFSVGENVKKFANEKRNAIKSASSDLFDEVASEGSQVFVDANSLKSSFMDSIGSFGLFDGHGKKLGFNAELGISQGEFSRLQSALSPIVDSLSKGKALPGARAGLVSGQDRKYFNANSLNAFRKTIQAEIREAKSQGVSDVILNKIKNQYEDVIENMLDSQSKGLANKWKTARGLWRKQIELSDIIDRGGKKGLNLNSMSNENIAKDIFSNTEKLKLFREATDDKTVKTLANQHIFDVIKQSTDDSGKVNSKKVFSKLYSKEFQLKKAIGTKKYNSVIGGIRSLGDVDLLEKGNAQKLKKLGLSGTSSEMIPAKIMANIDAMKSYQKEFGDKEVKKAAKEYIFDIFKSKTNSKKVFRPTEAYNIIKKKRELFERSLGKKEYESLVDNLTFLDEIRYNPNPSGTFWTQLRADPVKAIVLAAKEGGKLKIRKGFAALPEVANKKARQLIQLSGQDAKTGAGFGARKLLAEKENKNKKRRPAKTMGDLLKVGK